VGGKVFFSSYSGGWKGILFFLFRWLERYSFLPIQVVGKVFFSSSPLAGEERGGGGFYIQVIVKFNEKAPLPK